MNAKSKVKNIPSQDTSLDLGVIDEALNLHKKSKQEPNEHRIVHTLIIVAICILFFAAIAYASLSRSGVSTVEPSEADAETIFTE